MAMDFVGFGRSDKFTDQKDYSFELHLGTLKNFIRYLDIKDITLVTQDWGGLIGLTAATQMEERFSRLVIMNTFLPTGDEPLPMAFLRWRSFTERVGTKIPIGRSIKGGVARPEKITDEILAGYEAPFPDEKFKAGAAAWPLLVPLEPKDPGASEMRMARLALSNWQKPVLIMFSDSDPITKGGEKFFKDLIPSAEEYPLITLKNAGHFLQEDKGEELAEHIADFVEATTLS